MLFVVPALYEVPAADTGSTPAVAHDIERLSAQLTRYETLHTDRSDFVMWTDGAAWP